MNTSKITAAAAQTDTDSLSPDLTAGIAAYRRTWARFDGLLVHAQCGKEPHQRETGTFYAGNCQPTITTPEGRVYHVRDLGSLRVA